MTKTIKTYDGSEHLVTDTWYQKNVIEAGVKEEDEARRLAILNLSNDRFLTDKEKLELEALTNWKNVNNAYRKFGDFYKDHYPALDHVHGMTHTTDCGCSKHILFDHYGELPQVEHKVLKICKEHNGD